MVTLRGVRMYEFLDRFVTIALPRVRDFRGISAVREELRRSRQLQHRRQGTDHLPRIEYDKVDALRGLNISITTTRQDRRRMPRPCWLHSSSRSRTEVRPVAKVPLQRELAREKLAQVRQEVCRTEGDHRRPRKSEAKSAMPTPVLSCRSCPPATPTHLPAQPLRDHRSSAWHLPSIRSGPQQDP